jgi:hypothetical protein
MTSAIWEGITGLAYAGGYLWTCDGRATGFGNSNDIPTSVNFVTVLDPTTTPYPRVVKKIDLRQYIGPYIKNMRKIKKSPDGTRIYACTSGWHGQYSDRGIHGQVDTSFGTRFFSFADRPGLGGGFSPNYIGLTVTISGAADPNNNGTFPIDSDGNITNPLASTDANNGSLIWHLNTPGQSIIGSPCGYVIIIDVATKTVVGLAQLKNGIIADGSIFGNPSDLGDGSEARDCLEDNSGNLWVINASAGGAGQGISLLEKFNIATVISNGPGVQSTSSQQISVTRHAEEICFDSGFIWTASGYVGNTTFGGLTGKGIVSRIDPGAGTISIYQDSTHGIFGMLSDSTGRSPFPGNLYAFTTNTFTPRNRLLRFDPTQFPSASFRTTDFFTFLQADGGAIGSDGTNLWAGSRSTLSVSRSSIVKLPPTDISDAAILDEIDSNSPPFSDSGLGVWSLEFDGTWMWGARRGFNGRTNGNFINCGLQQADPFAAQYSNTFQNAAGDNVMQLWNGQFTGWVMQARSSSNGQLYTWSWPYPDFTGTAYPGPGSPEEIAVDAFSPLGSISVVMQARSSADSSLVTWLAPTEDFAGTLFPGPGTPLQTTVLSRNLVTSATNIQIKMQAVDSITNEIVTWDALPSSPDFGGFGYPGPGTPSEIAIHQIKYNT